MKTFKFSLLFIAGILGTAVFSGCDLLNAPEIDIGDHIDEAVAWANATRLTVRVEYPADWGSSNPAQGTITPARDIRRGFPFDLEFNPGGIY
ncbi:MAG: hypothetical protein LBK13_03065, partial [Spirochaetales bacterium]|nr:hypothetical protein [Spirochaetales bacterium]